MERREAMIAMKLVLKEASRAVVLTSTPRIACGERKSEREKEKGWERVRDSGRDREKIDSEKKET